MQKTSPSTTNSNHKTVTNSHSLNINQNHNQYSNPTNSHCPILANNDPISPIFNAETNSPELPTIQTQNSISRNPQLKVLKCWYTNATSIKNKYNEFIISINRHNPHIILVTETWLEEDSFNLQIILHLTGAEEMVDAVKA